MRKHQYFIKNIYFSPIVLYLEVSVETMLCHLHSRHLIFFFTTDVKASSYSGHRVCKLYISNRRRVLKLLDGKSPKSFNACSGVIQGRIGQFTAWAGSHGPRSQIAFPLLKRNLKTWGVGAGGEKLTRKSHYWRFSVSPFVSRWQNGISSNENQNKIPTSKTRSMPR